MVNRPMDAGLKVNVKKGSAWVGDMHTVELVDTTCKTQEEVDAACSEPAAFAGIDVGYLCAHCCRVRGRSTDTATPTENDCTLCGDKTEYTYRAPLSQIYPKGSLVAELREKVKRGHQALVESETEQERLYDQSEEFRDEMMRLQDEVQRLKADAELGALVRGMPENGVLKRWKAGWGYRTEPELPLNFDVTGPNPEWVLSTVSEEVKP